MNKPITINGMNILKEKLQKLKELKKEYTEKRRNDYFQAPADDPDYQFLVEQLDDVDKKIRNMETTISSSTILSQDQIKDDGVVRFGKTVLLINCDDEDDTREYTIVGESESNIEEGLISYSCNLGKELTGKEIDDEITIADHYYYISEIKIN